MDTMKRKTARKCYTVQWKTLNSDIKAFKCYIKPCMPARTRKKPLACLCDNIYELESRHRLSQPDSASRIPESDR